MKKIIPTLSLIITTALLGGCAKNNPISEQTSNPIYQESVNTPATVEFQCKNGASGNGLYKINDNDGIDTVYVEAMFSDTTIKKTFPIGGRLKTKYIPVCDITDATFLEKQRELNSNPSYTRSQAPVLYTFLTVDSKGTVSDTTLPFK
ncbi:MAG: hypothetical protein WC755_02520 [Candidatus Woesearchaeota archaeon]|jgi:hypothetical protein